jgi:hypothetical protein
MTKRMSFSMCAAARGIIPCLAAALLGVPTTAQVKTGSYIILLASGPLCDPNDPVTCLATARSSQGDSYEMTGAGIFEPQKKSVEAAGTFRHKSPEGNLLETGVWIASELVSFDFYGIDPSVLPRLGMPLDPDALGPKHPAMLSGQMPTGGLAVFRIRLLAISRPSRTAVLQVNCTLGNVPSDRSAEGIRLTFEGGSDYPTEAGGRAMFLAVRGALGPPAKGSRREPAPYAAAGPPFKANE